MSFEYIDPQDEKLTSAYLTIINYFGIGDILDEIVDPNLFEVLPKDQEKRARSAVSERITIIPKAKRLYEVISFSNDPPRKYFIALGTTTSCTCEDFMYNCGPETGIVCKHIWRARMMINQQHPSNPPLRMSGSALPTPEENPYNWLCVQFERERRLLRGAHPDLFGELVTLHQLILDDGSFNLDYHLAFRRRAEILNQIDLIHMDVPYDNPSNYDPADLEVISQRNEADND